MYKAGCLGRRIHYFRISGRYRYRYVSTVESARGSLNQATGRRAAPASHPDADRRAVRASRFAGSPTRDKHRHAGLPRGRQRD